MPSGITGDEIMVALDKAYPDATIFFLDEIQNFEKWEPFLHRLHREGRNKNLIGNDWLEFGTAIGRRQAGALNLMKRFGKQAATIKASIEDSFLDQSEKDELWNLVRECLGRSSDAIV